LVSASSAGQSEQATQRVTEYLQEHAGDLLGAVGSLVGAVFSVFTVGLFTFYLTANGPQVRRVLLSRMPPERQHRVLWAWNTAIDKTGGYLYCRALLALINGGPMFLTLRLLGVPYPLSRGRCRCWWPWPRSASRRRCWCWSRSWPTSNWRTTCSAPG
jgi:predicted PurR-regulated permease PerM